MATTIAELSTEVERMSADVQRALDAIQHQGWRLMEFQGDLRNLDMRIDNITPNTLNLNVIPTSKMVTAGVIVGAALGGYIAYVEVQRRLKNKKQD